MLKPTQGLDKSINTFPMGISPKMNVTEQLEFELLCHCENPWLWKFSSVRFLQRSSDNICSTTFVRITIVINPLILGCD